MPADLAVPEPQGWLAFFVARLPCLWFAFMPPSPRPPSRREGGDFLFSYARGFAPCIPGAEPGRHRNRGAYHALAGGACPAGCRLTLPPSSPAGGVPSLLPAYPAFSLLCCPHPPAPLPSGKGEIFCFLMQGASPLASPGLNPGGTGAGVRITRWRGACPAGCRLTLPPLSPTGGLPSLSLANPAFGLLSCPHPPAPLPGGKGEIFSFLMQGASPLASPGLNPWFAAKPTGRGSL